MRAKQPRRAQVLKYLFVRMPNNTFDRRARDWTQLFVLRFTYCYNQSECFVWIVKPLVVATLKAVRLESKLPQHELVYLERS